MPQSRVLEVTLDAEKAFHLTVELARCRTGERILVQTSVTQHGVGLADTSSVVARADDAGPGVAALTVELVAPQRSGVNFDPDAPLLMHTRTTTVWSTVLAPAGPSGWRAEPSPSPR